MLSFGVMAGMLEPFGVAMAADINAIAFSLLPKSKSAAPGQRRRFAF